MTDYSELVKALRCCGNEGCHKCPYQKHIHEKFCWVMAMKDAAAAIEALQAQLPKRGEIVRCKDCKWRLSCGYISTRSYAEWKDWFCADGAKMEVQE